MFFQNFDQRDSDAQYTTLPHDQTPKLVAEPGRDKLIVPSFTANADLGFANLIAVTGNYERQFHRTLDSSIYDNLAVYLVRSEHGHLQRPARPAGRSAFAATTRPATPYTARRLGCSTR